MNNLDLPPFPVPGASGPHVCEAVRFYLALVDELPFEQVRILSEHVKECAACAAEFQRLQQSSRLLASLPESTPSARVDEAIQTFLRAQQRSGNRPAAHAPAMEPLARQLRPLGGRRRTTFTRRRMGLLSLAAAALLVLAVASILLRGVIWPTSNATAFQLPANLSWSGYVLHYTQTQHDEQGKAYQVEVYQDLGTNQMHIESRMQGTFDVVVVTDQQDMLGKDMMHHIAQKGQDVEAWAVDGSVFDLEELRQDLSTQRASYLGSGTFAGQKVYQIRASNGRILLLNMHYFPVNVLPTSANASTPMYSTCELMPVAQVSDSMWDMSVPANFHMGKLPARA